MAIQTTKAQLKKLKKINEGGEANIYAYDADSVLKIYKSPNMLSVKEQKVQAMIGKTIMGGLAILPTEIVTVGGQFVGYRMPMVASGEPLHSFTKARFMRGNGFTNQDALQIVTQLGHAMDDVHNAGFVIGDVSDNNFMASLDAGHQICLIDTDSWGVGRFPPDAYTETFMPAEAYGPRGMKLTEETDNFGFGILAFNVLTRIHPFGGSYKKNPNMNTVERIKKQLSLLGIHEIVYNESLFNWTWMNPDLLAKLKDMFEGSYRGSITAELDELSYHSKICKIHNAVYFDHYADCPLCAGVAKLKKVTPVVVTTTATGPKVVVLFNRPDVHMMLGADAYFDTAGNIVYIPTGKSFPRIKNSRMYFASGGKFLVTVRNSLLTVQDSEGQEVSRIERMTNSSFAVEGASLLYADTGDQIHRLLLSTAGIQQEALFQGSNPLLALNEFGEYFVVNRYLDRIMISYKNHDVEIPVTPKIKEYAIKYDAKTKTWVFIYEEQNGSFRTMVFGENGKEYDDNVYRYAAAPLLNICYHNGSIYDPGTKAITGTNLKKGSSKVFQCDDVDETCMLKYDNGGFVIIGDTTVKRFG
ncbi:hypothetical protein IK110_03260 [Candidatus Saccharibacteria bacterium]|nr:hypothetical protein [Candidatus Saccharibacteria bacterium]